MTEAKVTISGAFGFGGVVLLLVAALSGLGGVFLTAVVVVPSGAVVIDVLSKPATSFFVSKIEGVSAEVSGLVSVFEVESLLQLGAVTFNWSSFGSFLSAASPCPSLTIFILDFCSILFINSAVEGVVVAVDNAILMDG